MDTRTDAVPDPIVGTFARWLKTLKETAARVDGEHDVQVLEQELRDGGRAILQSLFEQLLQGIIDRGQESLRTCPDCGGDVGHLLEHGKCRTAENVYPAKRMRPVADIWRPR